jgi:hypothetical protein
MLHMRILPGSRSLVIISAACLATALSAGGRAAADPPPESALKVADIPIVFHVAVEKKDGQPTPVVPIEILDTAIAKTNAIYTQQVGMRFHRRAVHLLPTGKSLDVVGRWGRNRLARVAGAPPPGAVEVFMVRSLRDLKRSWAKLPGVMWYAYQGPGQGRRYVIVSQTAGLETMAHELGHYFGLVHHPSRKNLMLPGAARVDSRLNGSQVYYMRKKLEMLLADKTLQTPVTPVEVIPTTASAPAGAGTPPAATAAGAAAAASSGPGTTGSGDAARPTGQGPTWNATSQGAQ